MRRVSKKRGKKIESDAIFFFDSHTAPAHTKPSLCVGVLISKQALSEESAFQAPQHNKFVVTRR